MDDKLVDQVKMIVSTFLKGSRGLSEEVLEDPEAPGYRELIREAAEEDMKGIVRIRSEIIRATPTGASFLIKKDATLLVPVPVNFVPLEEDLLVYTEWFKPDEDGVKRTHASPLSVSEFCEWAGVVYKAAKESGRDTEALHYPGILCWSPQSELIFGWEGDDWVEAEFEIARVMLE